MNSRTEIRAGDLVTCDVGWFADRGGGPGLVLKTFRWARGRDITVYRGGDIRIIPESYVRLVQIDMKQ